MQHQLQAQQSFTVLTFRVAELVCAIRADAVSEIVPLASTVGIPGQPSIVEGFLNLRGEMVPVIRVAVLFGLEFEPSVYSPIIITRNRETALGLLVDRAEDVTMIETSGLKDIFENHAVNDCAEAEFICDGQSVILIAMEKLLFREEAHRIGELRTRVGDRLRDVRDLPQ